MRASRSSAFSLLLMLLAAIGVGAAGHQQQRQQQHQMLLAENEAPDKPEPSAEAPFAGMFRSPPPFIYPSRVVCSMEVLALPIFDSPATSSLVCMPRLALTCLLHMLCLPCISRRVLLPHPLCGVGVWPRTAGEGCFYSRYASMYALTFNIFKLKKTI